MPDVTFKRLKNGSLEVYYRGSKIGEVWRVSHPRGWRYDGNLYGSAGEFKTRKAAVEQLLVENDL